MVLLHNTKTLVNEKQYHYIMTKLSGTCAGIIEDDKFYIKLMIFNYKNLVQSYLNS